VLHLVSNWVWDSTILWWSISGEDCSITEDFLAATDRSAVAFFVVNGFSTSEYQGRSSFHSSGLSGFVLAIARVRTFGNSWWMRWNSKDSLMMKVLSCSGGNHPAMDHYGFWAD